MTPEELKALLGLKPRQPTLTEVMIDEDLLDLPGGRYGPTIETSPFALELDEWDQARGAKLLRHSHEARETGLSPAEFSDLHGAAFLSSPALVEKCTDARRHGYVKNLLESPDYKALHPRTEHDPVASELAAVAFGQAYSKLKEEDQERERENEKKKQQGKRTDPARDKMRSEMVCAAAAGAALKDAEKEVEKYEDVRSALGCGKGPGGPGKVDPGKVAALFARVRNSERLRNIIDKAGAYRRFAQGRQRRKQAHGYDDLVGVVLDGDVGRLLPTELALLATPETEDDALRRLVERQSMCYERKGVEKVGKGPFVVCVDESGSMSGEPVENAKAFALAMAYNARHQGRWCCLCGFAGGTEGTRLVLPPGKWDEGALLDWLEHFYSGGTTCDIPLVELPSRWWPEFIKTGMQQGRTDLIIVSDAIVNVPPEVEKNFNAWKKENQCKTHGIIIGQRTAGDLVRVLDSIYFSTGISTNDEGVQQMLSL